MRRLLKKIFLSNPKKKVDWNFELRLRQFNFFNFQEIIQLLFIRKFMKNINE